MRIRDWSSDVCSSDLPLKSSPKDGDDANQLVVVARLRSLALKLIFWRLVRKTYGYTGKFSEDRRAALSSRAGCRAVCERKAACRHHARWPNRVCRASAARRYPHEAAAGASRGRAGWSGSEERRAGKAGDEQG